MVTMAQSAMNWRNTHTYMDHTHSLMHLHQHSYNHVVRSAIIFSARWVFSCFCNLPNSDMDYRIFIVIILVRACTHRGWAHRQRVSATFLTWKNSHIFLVLLTGFEPSSLFVAPTLYQLSHPVTSLTCFTLPSPYLTSSLYLTVHHLSSPYKDSVHHFTSSLHLTFHHLISSFHRTSSPNLTLSHLTLPYLTLHYLTSSLHFTFHHLTPSLQFTFFTSPYLISPYLTLLYFNVSLRMSPWWSLCTLCLLHARWSYGRWLGSLLCCCVPVQCVTSIVRAQLLPIVCWFYLTLPHLTLPYTTSLHHFTPSPHLTFSPQSTLSHLSLVYLTLPYLPYLTLPYFTFHHLT